MVVLNRIYTRTGDDGTTSLGTGARRKKYDLRVEAYGTVDEVNAVIGLVRLHVAGNKALDAALGRIQNDLFDVVRSAIRRGDKHVLYACAECECAPPGAHSEFLLPDFQEL